MGYTKRKIRGISLSFLLAAFVFSCGATYCASYGWPRGFRAGSSAGFGLGAVAALLFTAFPFVWMLFPEKHPVRRERSRYGDLAQVLERLDVEMAGHAEILGPFRFTATMLVYDIGYEFQMVPYDQIVRSEIEWSTTGEPPAIPTIVVYT